MKMKFNPLTDLGLVFKSIPGDIEHHASVTFENGAYMILDVFPGDDKYDFRSYDPSGAESNYGYGDCVEDFQKEVSRLASYKRRYYGKAIIIDSNGNKREEEFYRWVTDKDEERYDIFLEAAICFEPKSRRR